MALGTGGLSKSASDFLMRDAQSVVDFFVLMLAVGGPREMLRATVQHMQGNRGFLAVEAKMQVRATDLQ